VTSAALQKEISCSSCGARFAVAAERLTADCPFCASHAIVDADAGAGGAAETPSYTIPFVLDPDQAREKLAVWKRTRGFFRHSGIRHAKVLEAKGIYLPVWLYSAAAFTRFAAEIGEDYTVTETYTTTDSKGNSVTRTRTRTKTEWRDLQGKHDAYVLDILVTGSTGIPNDELENIEPFDLRALRKHDASLVLGWIAERPTLDFDKSRDLAEQEAGAELERRLNAFLPGDSHRALRFDTDLRNQDFDLLLLPVYVFVVRHAEDQPPIRVLVNGQTGRCHGTAPLSLKRIGAVVLAAILLGFLFYLFAGGIS